MFKIIALVFIAHMFVVGICGIVVRLHVASFLLAKESTESPKFSTRFFYRYFLFWTNYMMSFFITPALIIEPIFGSFEALADSRAVRGIIIALTCLPLAITFHWLERRLLVWGEARKIRGMEDFNRKYGSRRR